MIRTGVDTCKFQLHISFYKLTHSCRNASLCSYSDAIYHRNDNDDNRDAKYRMLRFYAR